MTGHARKPAIWALVVGGLAATGLLAATGQFRSSDRAPVSLDELEKTIASGKADAGTWQAYGDALREKKRFAHAAAAYQRSLEMDPDRPTARFSEALSLGQANTPDRFFEFYTQLTAHDPKQAVDLLERAELAPLHDDPRWESAAAAARGQAAD
jgi:tetratricopeptide (TPR) repeat protein